MDRRDTVLALLALGAAPFAEAQQAAKVARIGHLATNPATSPHLREPFLQGLRDLGYVEGRNLVIEYRDAEGKVDRLPALAAELVALKVDVIVASGTLAALAAKQTTRTLPIVFSPAGDPVGSGLVTSLAWPGGNITGLSAFAPELVGKRLELLKQAVPGVSRVAVLWQPGAFGERAERDILKRAEIAARDLRVQLQFVEARGPADFAKAFSHMSMARADALTVLASNMFNSERRRLVDLAAAKRLPAVYSARELVDAGGLMSYGTNLADLNRRAATYVDRILKGTKPADLPVEQPAKFELIINLKTANTLGLTILRYIATGTVAPSATLTVRTDPQGNRAGFEYAKYTFTSVLFTSIGQGLNGPGRLVSKGAFVYKTIREEAFAPGNPVPLSCTLWDVVAGTVTDCK